MREALKHYIDGKWVDPVSLAATDVINPATEKPVGRVALGGGKDVHLAARAARRAFASYGRFTRQERIDLLEAIIGEYKKRRTDVAEAITSEMGAPAELAQQLHAAIGHVHLKIALNVLKDFEFSRQRGDTRVEFEPIGVCGLITPWNWPINQIAAKVVPAGVFNLVQGDGPGVGAPIAAHPDVDMVSFTGSTRAGIAVACAAAPSVKRVHQELGGKSANILLPDAEIGEAAAAGFRALVANAGQSCNAPTRMLVPNTRREEAVKALADVAAALSVGDPLNSPDVGPVASRNQFDKIQTLIALGVEEGATVIAGGPGRPEGLDTGFYVRPTVFADVTNEMTIAREEIFGPVLCVIGYDNIDEAVAIANDSIYGLAAYIQGEDEALIADVASRLRVGQVLVNQPHPDGMAPFGGYKQSGNGREWGDFGFESFLEVKAVLGTKSAAHPIISEDSEQVRGHV